MEPSPNVDHCLITDLGKQTRRVDLVDEQQRLPLHVDPFPRLSR